MGINTDGQLSFGIPFDEGFEFPWETTHGGDENQWWMDVNEYHNPNPSPYDDQGDYKPGLSYESPETQAYLDHKFNWKKQYPFPVEIINYCSDSCPMIILAVKHLECSRGCPQEVNPDFLQVSSEEKDKLLSFCLKYEIETVEEPKWWLTSYWG